MKFVISGAYYKDKTFPGLNEYLHEIGMNPRAGGRMKKDYQMIACNAIRRALRRQKATKPIIIHYDFFEPKKGQKRDLMNIFSFADKVIEDALQDCGVIPNDSPEYVRNTTHDFFYCDKPRIEVTLIEAE